MSRTGQVCTQADSDNHLSEVERSQDDECRLASDERAAGTGQSPCLVGGTQGGHIPLEVLTSEGLMGSVLALQTRKGQ